MAAPSSSEAVIAKPVVSPRVAPRLPRLSVLIPAVVLSVVMAGCIAAPLVAGDPNTTELLNVRAPVLTEGHLLGTDGFGRDQLSRVLYGGRISLTVGLAVALICMAFGGGLGISAGYWGGRIDSFTMRGMDVLLAFPSLVLALTLAAALGPSTRNVILAVSLSQIPAYSRVARAAALSLRERESIVCSRLMGGSHLHIMVRHLLPNVLVPLVAYALLAVATSMIIEASLSFLGLGVQPPTPSWGVMIAEGRSELSRAPHVVLVPGAVLALTILSINLLGDSLRARSRTQLPSAI